MCRRIDWPSGNAYPPTLPPLSEAISVFVASRLPRRLVESRRRHVRPRYISQPTYVRPVIRRELPTTVRRTTLPARRRTAPNGKCSRPNASSGAFFGSTVYLDKFSDRGSISIYGSGHGSLKTIARCSTLTSKLNYVYCICCGCMKLTQ